jgi:bifunctional non-homologous end joining protein LigD
MGRRVEVEVGERTLSLSNLDKVLYPESGFRKRDVLDYYRQVGPVLLAHLEGRPPTLVRAPDGVAGERFFEKRCPPHHLKWVPVADPVEAAGGTRGCIVQELATLVWLANLAALELHTHQWTLDAPGAPVALVLDLDPGAPAGMLDCCRVALELRAVLERFDLTCLVKTSGGKGLHLSVPLHGADVSDDDTKRFALGLGQLLASRDPQRVTVEMAKDERTGKVFVDWSQNDRHKTTVAPYSLRVRDRPTVSTPVTWDEIEDARAAGDEGALRFEATDVLTRVEEHGDLFAANLTVRQDLPAL